MAPCRRPPPSCAAACLVVLVQHSRASWWDQPCWKARVTGYYVARSNSRGERLALGLCVQLCFLFLHFFHQPIPAITAGLPTERTSLDMRMAISTTSHAGQRQILAHFAPQLIDGVCGAWCKCHGCVFARESGGGIDFLWRLRCVMWILI